MEYIADNPFNSARQIIEDLQLDVSEDTVRRHLKKAQLHARIPAKKPALTPEHKRQRRIFCRKYLERGLDDWYLTTFLDEKYVKSTQISCGRRFVWRVDGTRYLFHWEQCDYVQLEEMVYIGFFLFTLFFITLFL